MDFKEIVLLTYSSIKERKIRNALTILMIIMGCGLLVSLSSLSQGLISFVEQYFNRILPNQIIISNTDKIQESNVDNIRNKLQILFDPNATLLEERIPFNSDAMKFLNTLDGVERIDPAYQGVTVLKYGNNSHITNVLASDLAKLDNIIPNLNLNTVNKLKESTDINFVIIPEKISEKIQLIPKNIDLTSLENELQEMQQPQELLLTLPTITIQNIRDATAAAATTTSTTSISNLTTNVSNNNGNNNNNKINIKTGDNEFFVIQTVNSTGNPILDNSVFMDITTGKKILQKPGDYDLLFIKYDDPDKVDDIVNNIQNYFNNQVTILNSLEIIKSLTTMIVGISAFISSIAIFSLIVGAIGIVITIYTSVVERTREIGIIKALGGTNRMVLTMFLTESTFIGLIGAFMGVVFGFIGSYILLNGFLYFLNIPLAIFPVFNFIEISKIIVTVVSLSIIAGLYPAYRGSRISPVNALTKLT